MNDGVVVCSRPGEPAALKCPECGGRSEKTRVYTETPIAPHLPHDRTFRGSRRAMVLRCGHGFDDWHLEVELDGEGYATRVALSQTRLVPDHARWWDR